MEELSSSPRLKIEDASVHLSSGLVERQGVSTRLEPKAVEVLCRLLERPGEILSKEELLSSVWVDTAVSDDVLWRTISELRRAFGDDPASPRFIETLARRGYRLVASVEPLREKKEFSVPEAPKAPKAFLPSVPLMKKPYIRRAWPLVLVFLSLLWGQESAPRTTFRVPPGVNPEMVQGLWKARVYRETVGEARVDADWTAAGLDAAHRGGLHGVSSPLAFRHTGDALLARGRVETAVLHYQEALLLDPQAASLGERGQRFRERNAVYAEEVSPYFEGNRLPESFEERLAIARKLRLLERTKASRWLLGKLLEERPGNFEAFRELTILDLSQASLKEARARLEGRLRLDPDSVDLLSLGGELELLAGNREAALRYFDRACLAQMELDGSPERKSSSKRDRRDLMLCWAG